jgi:hypothetical protein
LGIYACCVARTVPALAIREHLQNYLASSTLPITVIIGIVFVACVLLFRRGIVGELIARLDRRAAK